MQKKGIEKIMADVLEIRVNVDMVLHILATELEDAFGSKDTEAILGQVIQALEVNPEEEDTQNSLVNKWVQDNEPDFDVHGVQATWC